LSCAGGLLSGQAMTVGEDGAGHDECGAEKRGGGHCTQAAGWGTDHPGIGACKLHGGCTPNHRKAAEIVRVEREAACQLRAEGYEPTVNPVEELLSLGAEVTALKDVLRGRVATLSDPEWVTTSKLAVEDVAAVVRAYERALDRCERTLTNMLRLDLEQRLIHLAERDAEMIWRAIGAGLAAIGASDHAQTFRAAFAEDLRDAA
jgi:hypothetical protein